MSASLLLEIAFINLQPVFTLCQPLRTSPIILQETSLIASSMWQQQMLPTRQLRERGWLTCRNYRK